jgi:hypothetical protein
MQIDIVLHLLLQFEFLIFFPNYSDQHFNYYVEYKS